MLQSLGRHILVECYECDDSLLNDPGEIERAMNQAAVAAGATIVSSTFHRFNPHGVSGVVVIAESHLAIHTWPEFGYAAVDLFTCGDECDPWRGFEFLREALGVQRIVTTELRRGSFDTNGQPLSHKPMEVKTPEGLALENPAPAAS